MPNFKEDTEPNQALIHNCTNCGNRVERLADYCGRCGENLVAIKEYVAAQVSAMFCICGALKVSPPRPKTASELADRVRRGATGYHCYDCGADQLAAPRVIVR